VKRLAALLLLLVPFLLASAPASADEGWTITSFDATYVINQDGTIDVVEDIRVDFGPLQKHGIFREIPTEYEWDARHKRLIRIRVSSVDDGAGKPHRFQNERNGANLRIRIGDPDRTISGPQRYRIVYRVEGMLNAQDSWDEFYWNVTGNEWPVRITAVSANVQAPAVERIACFQGPRGSTEECRSQHSGAVATFSSGRQFGEGEGLTIVVAMPKGAVNVPPPTLEVIKTVEEQIRDFLGLSPLKISAALIVGVLSLFGVVRYWWMEGRDRWLGDLQYLTGATDETHRPAFAKDTVIVEYQPPEIGKRVKRRLRPAEIGTLMDERADTLDVTATIVDLAVRGYLRITEVEKTWLFGKKDYKLEKLKDKDDSLLSYERRLLDGLFDDGDSVLMSELKNSFYTDLAKVKEHLYSQVTSQNHFFAGNPEKVRSFHVVGALVTMGIGAALIYGLGELIGAALIGVPVVVAGLLLLLFSSAMPRRTGAGREMYRRCLGFRKYMTVAETDRQRFNEEIGLFQEYLPYAIVFGCVDKWAKAFEGLDTQETTGSWYVSSRPFSAAAFSSNLQSFSSSISSSIASTPGGSGGSGFSGGSSGGGGGGGGGGSW
jgi:uncharacterized membrane protein YgcG